jgi:hypothetical protein
MMASPKEISSASNSKEICINTNSALSVDAMLWRSSPQVLLDSSVTW